ncbi:MAG TPA: glycosyltransferase family 2 protein [Blastocatellia bacterium]|nr:glycosyltransferase family 2 protein [Blastocatellia bacterium]
MNVYKRLRKILPGRGVKIDVYALCWNEKRMLPYFFRHYDKLASRYFIFDNGSTDGSVEMLKLNRKVRLGSFEVKGDSFVGEALSRYNECWKQSRGEADWVIVCNVDEHIYHPDLKGYLKRCKRLGVSLIIPEGFNMVSEAFPETEGPLYETVKYGMRDQLMDKPEIFDPDKIDEINFGPGRHGANPTGEVVTPRNVKVKLLHYKYIGLDHLLRRHGELKSGLRPLDIKYGWGQHYLWDDEKKIEDYRRVKTNSVLVL